MHIKIHKSYRKIVALCDSELLGKKFEEGNRQLDIRENFYNGEEINWERAVGMLKDLASDDATFNIAGEKAIGVAIEAGLMNAEGTMTVKGIPFALILL